MVEPYVCDVSLYLWNALKEGKEVLLEGQLGSLKDPDHGTAFPDKCLEMKVRILLLLLLFSF